MRLLSPTGMLGTGFPEASLRRGLAWQPDVIACDAGSTDSGPADLGAGSCRYPKRSYQRDLGLLLRAARERRIPLIIGSAGGAGGRANVDWTLDILRELAAGAGLHFKLAVIYSDQDPAYLARRLREGRIKPLGHAAPLTDEVIARSTTIVGMMGCEPIIRALQAGADVVLAGRASDTAIFAAVPIMRGHAPGPVWHAAKILECGAAAVEFRPAPDCLFAWIGDDDFVVKAPNGALRCTPTSVAAHALYENTNPFRIVEPGGVINLTGAAYEPFEDTGVRVTGSRFDPAATYSVKLEGVELAGYQTITIGGIADPTILRALDEFLAATHARTTERYRYTWPELREGAWHLAYRVYGRGDVVQRGPAAAEPADHPRDVGVIVEVTAETQELANAMTSIARHQLLHQPVARWEGFVSNLALPYGGRDFPRGPVYRFNMNHVVEPDDPYEMVEIQYQDV